MFFAYVGLVTIERGLSAVQSFYIFELAVNHSHGAMLDRPKAAVPLKIHAEDGSGWKILLFKSGLQRSSIHPSGDVPSQQVDNRRQQVSLLGGLVNSLAFVLARKVNEQRYAD